MKHGLPGNMVLVVQRPCHEKEHYCQDCITISMYNRTDAPSARHG